MKKATPITLLSFFALATLASCGSETARSSTTPPFSETTESGKTSGTTPSQNLDGKIIVGDIRIEILNEDTFRFEKRMDDGTFLDSNTFFIPNRDAYKGCSYKVSELGEKTTIEVGDAVISIPSAATTFKNLNITINGEIVYEYEASKNTGTLPSPKNTPEAYAVYDSPRIIVPDHGYAYSDEYGANIDFDIQYNALDFYVLLPRKDAKALRQQYVNLTGKTEMVRLQTLGLWDSKYYAYSEKTALEEIDTYAKYDLPLDNMVIDTDWRKSYGADGIGYDVNTSLFPDMEGFLDKAEAKNIDIMFNDHPEPASGSKSVLDPIDVEYRETNLRKYLAMGLDYWWYDRNWSVALKAPSNTFNAETWGMYLYSDITTAYNQEQAGDNYIYRRPIIMGNADNIQNGAFVGVRNSASHRYSIQWTGDIDASTSSLSQEVANIVKGGSSGLAYLNSDIGGHNGNPSNELYIRWLQYGAFSPILRPHSSKYNQRYRQPWLYGDQALDISREYINMRYRLMPLLYSLCHENYETGLPLFRYLSFEYPDDENADRTDEYLMGDNILIAPISEDKYSIFPESWYKSNVTAKFYNNKNLSGEPAATKEYDSIDFDWGTSSPATGVDSDNFSATFETTVEPKEDITISVMADDGVRMYVDGERVVNAWQANDSVTFDGIKLEKGTTHTVKVEYYEGSGNAILKLKAKKETDIYSKDVYLPEGTWMNLFTGEAFTGKQTVKVDCSLSQMPIFVKLGTMVPLVDEVDNTRHIDWSNLSFDYYPSKENGTYSGEFYEDDYNSTAYKFGQYRTTGYSTHYDSSENALVINVGKANGTYEGSDKLTNRHFKIRYHALEELGDFSKITLNGKAIGAYYYEKEEGAYPLQASRSDSVSDVYSIEFDSDISKDNVVKIYLK